MQKPWEDNSGLERLWPPAGSEDILADLRAFVESVRTLPAVQPLVLTSAQYEMLVRAMQHKTKPQPMPGFNRAQRRARKRAGLPYLLEQVKK